MTSRRKKAKKGPKTPLPPRWAQWLADKRNGIKMQILLILKQFIYTVHQELQDIPKITSMLITALGNRSKNLIFITNR